MTREEAQAQINVYLEDIENTMGFIEALAENYDIPVAHPYRDYEHGGTHTFHTWNTFVEAEEWEHLREQAEEENESLESFLSRDRYGNKDSFPRWVSSYDYE